MKKFVEELGMVPKSDFQVALLTLRAAFQYSETCKITPV